MAMNSKLKNVLFAKEILSYHKGHLNWADNVVFH